MQKIRNWVQERQCSSLFRACTAHACRVHSPPQLRPLDRGSMAPHSPLPVALPRAHALAGLASRRATRHRLRLLRLRRCLTSHPCLASHLPTARRPGACPLPPAQSPALPGRRCPLLSARTPHASSYPCTRRCTHTILRSQHTHDPVHRHSPVHIHNLAQSALQGTHVHVPVMPKMYVLPPSQGLSGRTSREGNRGHDAQHCSKAAAPFFGNACTKR